MTAMVSIILGVGLPASATYLVVAIVLAPLLIDKGIPLLPAHMFAFYFANFSFLTPPVAIAALFGAQLAGAPYLKTSTEAAKVGIAGFVLPFMVIWIPAFLGDFSKPLVSFTQLFFCAVVFMELQAGFVGYLLTRMQWFERITAIIGPLCFMFYLYNKNILWFTPAVVLMGATITWQIIKRRRA